jgi:hypothetical protein
VLTDIPLQLAYRAGRDELVKDFMVPCLDPAVLYRRSAGYFTSAAIGMAAREVASLAARGGRMRLAASPHLEPHLVEALHQAHERPEEALRRSAGRSLAEIEDVLVRERLNTLAWQAASGRLEIRLALRTGGSGGFSRGIFHEKSDVPIDAPGNHVAFTRSSTETAGGLLENFESIDVYRSWCDPERRVEQKIADFEPLWQDRTRRLIYFNSKVAEKNSPRVIIVLCPFLNLCSQRCREMPAFGLTPVPCSEIHHQWGTRIEEGFHRPTAGLPKVHARSAFQKHDRHPVVAFENDTGEHPRRGNPQRPCIERFEIRRIPVRHLPHLRLSN